MGQSICQKHRQYFLHSMLEARLIRVEAHQIAQGSTWGSAGGRVDSFSARIDPSATPSYIYYPRFPLKIGRHLQGSLILVMSVQDLFTYQIRLS